MSGLELYFRIMTCVLSLVSAFFITYAYNQSIIIEQLKKKLKEKTNG